MTLPASFGRIPLAHRGLHDASRGIIENSLSAVGEAVSAGYGIEIDMRLSRDDVAIVFHDADLFRLTGSRGPVGDRTADDLGRIRLSGSEDVVPTLEAVLREIGGRVPVLIEIKDPSGRLEGSDGRIEAAVAAGLEGYAGDVAVMSFNPDIVAALARHAPHVPRGLTTCGFRPAEWDLPPERLDHLARIADFDRVGADFISHEAADLGNARVADLSRRRVGILSWTIRSTQEEAEARRVAANITFEGYRPAIPSASG